MNIRAPMPEERMSAAIDLPWPSSDLSPNARLHWAPKARAVREARAYAGWLAVSTRAFERLKGAERLKVVVTFTPPDRHRRDDDNMLASIKPYCDGVADVIGIDDSRWTISMRREPPRKPGSVRIEMEATP